MYNPEMLVFVDETGCDRHAALCSYMVTHYKGKENAIGPMCMDFGGHRRLPHLHK